GAGLGAIIGSQTGDAGAGVAIGSAIGALGGGLIGNEIDVAEAHLDESERRIRQNESIIEQNQRLIDEFKRQGADVRETRRGVVVNLPDVLFEFDSSRLTSKARGTIREIAEVLRDVGERRIAVE